MRLDLSRRSDHELLREFTALVTRDRHTTAELLAYVGEVQTRQLYLPACHSSMYWYCVHELRMSEDMAWRRTRVARLARRYPVILEMIADGRLHLTAVVRLLPHRLAPDFAQLLEAAAHKTKPELELLLAARFPRPDVPTEVRPLSMSSECQGLVPAPVREQTHIVLGSRLSGGVGADLLTPSAALPLEAPAPRARVEPLAPARFAIQVTVGQATHDKLRRAQELLGHQVAPGDLEQVLDRALDALLRQLEHARFAATEKPRPSARRSTVGKRHVPDQVKRAVWKRDGGRCTFVSDAGRRCEERRDLQYDHVDPFARGGEATVDRMRLLCKPHNQHEAERVYGAGFMASKREEASRRAAARRETGSSHAESPHRPIPPQ